MEFQAASYDDLQLFFVICDIKSNIFEFYIVGQTKQDIFMSLLWL